MNTNATRNRLDARSTTIFQRRLLPVLIAGCFAGNVSANPLGPQVVNGQVGFSNQGNVLSVTNTPGSIINWQSFSINPGEITRFIQQNPNSAVLNRIIGQDPSQILGALQSNGRVFLINPNGILFGQGAQVDVNGLVASTLNIANEDFLNGRLNFRAGDRAADLKNQGAITTPNGGQVFLIAPNVENSGIITSPQGDVLLAAGRSVQLVDSMNPDLHVVISAPENEALNLGQVIAQGGRTGIYGALVRQRGIVNANSAVVGENGKVVFKASRDALLEAGSVTTASGAGRGGEIHVLGERVGLTGDARVDASGLNGGGTILVGGDYQGANPAIRNASRTFVGSGTQLMADAVESGDGGKVIVWADDTARVHGQISARGGPQGGNGGFVETSGKQDLEFRARVDVSAPAGAGGTLLLDPSSITITGGSGDGDGNGSNLDFIGSLTGTANFADAGPTVIYQTELMGIFGGTNIVLEATRSITTSGDFGSLITLPANSNLTMRTRNSSTDTGGTQGINLIGSTNGTNLEFRAQGTGSITLESGTGTSTQAANIMAGKLTTKGGAVTINGNANVAVGAITTAPASGPGGNISVTSGAFLDFISNGNVDARGGSGGPTGDVTLVSGDYITVPSAVTIYADQLKMTAVKGIKNDASGPINIQASSLNALNTSNGPIKISNSVTNLSIADIGATGYGVKQQTSGELIDIQSAAGTTLTIDAPVLTNNGNVSLTATTINLQSGQQIGVTGSSGTEVRLKANEITVDGTINAGGPTGAGYVFMDPLDSTRPIDLGTKTAGTLGLTSAEMNRVSATELEFGTASGTGNITVSAPINLSNSSIRAFVFDTGGNIAINNPITVNADNGFLWAGILNGTGDISIGAGGGLITTGVNSQIFVKANNMTLGGAANSINAGTGNVFLLPKTAGAAIKLGQTAADVADTTLGLTEDELKTVTTSGKLTLGGFTATGGVSVDGALNLTTGNGSGLTGELAIESGSTLTQAGAITADKLSISTLGNVTLNSSNSVGTLAAETPGSFSFTNSGALAVGSVSGFNGVRSTGGGNITLQSTGSGVTVTNTGAADDIYTSSAGVISLQSAGSFSTATGSSVSGGKVDITTTAGGNISIDGNVTSTLASQAANVPTIQIGIGSASGHTVTTTGTLTAASGRIDISGQGGSITLNGAVTQQDVSGAVKITSQNAAGGGGTISGSGLITSNGIDLQSVAGIAGTRVIGSLNTAAIDTTGTTFKIGNTTPGEVTGLTINHSGKAIFPSGSFFVASNPTVNIQATGDLSVPGISTGTSNLTLKSTTGSLSTSGALAGYDVSLSALSSFSFSDGVSAANDLFIDLGNPGATLVLPASLTFGGSARTIIKADKMDFSAGALNVGGGGSFVSLLPKTGSRAITLGTDTTDAGSDLELSATDLSRVNAATLSIGDQTSGAINVGAAIAPPSVTTLALNSGSTIGQSGSITVTNLAIKALDNVSLLNPSNNVANLVANIGDSTHENKNFSFRNGANPLNIGSNIASLSGITIDLDVNGYSTSSPNGVISLISGGTLTQSASGTLGGKAVYAEGTRVTLTESNPTGVIAGKSTSGATGDMFRYASSNGISVTTVNSFPGIQSASTVDAAGVQLSAGSSGIFQSTDAPITSSKGLTLTTTGPIDLRAASNNVAALSASNAGTVNFYNSGALELGVGGAGISTSNQAIDIKSGGLLTVRDNVNAGTGTVALEAPDIQLGAAGAAGPAIQAGMVSLRANESAFNGWIMTAGTSATTITSTSGIALEADNMDLTTRAPVFNAANEVSYDTYSDNRSITIGGACNAAAPNCLKLNFGGVTNHAPDLVIGNKAATDTNTAGDIYVDAALTHPDYVEGATNASGRVALLTGGKISQTAAISATSLGFIAGTVTSSSTVNLNQANAISNVAGETKGGSITLNNTSALNVVQMTGGNPLYSDITTVNGLISNGGSVSLTNAGNVNLSAPVNASTAAVNFTVTGGAINGSGLITGGSLTASASSGIGNATALSTSVGTLDVTNTGTNSIGITNSGALTLQNALQTGAGAHGISIVNSGDLAVGTVTTDTGAISLSAYHKITVTGPVTSTGGNITLAAIGSGVPGNGDTLTINGSVSTNGNIALSAGDDIVISNPANVNAGSGTVTSTPNLNGPVSPPQPPPPTVAECTTNPNLSGCSSVLPSLDSCTANPTLAGCTAVLPTVDACTTNPTQAGCTAVLPTLSTCTTNPTQAGCTAVLPTLSTCTTNPTQAGCTAVLPTLSTCTTDPTQAGCTAVLPTLSTCTTDPTQAGCTAVLPTLSTCTTNPTQAGCTAVLPTLSTCTTSPTQAGCTAVLPSLSTCTTNPTQAGCTAVLPSLSTCTTSPTQAGCTAVLPSLSTCTTNPSQDGCSAVLPSVTQCIAAPTTPGCAAVPTMTSCTANPLLAGCSSVLPTLEACTTSPTQTGCSVVLPSMTTCTTNPTQAGCSAVLPTLASCATNPTQTGCSAVLPTLDACTTNPTQTGCAVILPTLSSCTTAPTLPGCSVVLPSLDSCTANQAQLGCTAVLPSVESCLGNSALAGCSTVLSSTSRCLREPTLPECQPVLPPDVTPAPPSVVLPPAETSPVVSVENSVIQHTAVSTPAMQTARPSQPSGTSTSSTSSTASSSTSSTSTSSSSSSSSTSSASERTSSTSNESTQQEASDDKKDEKKTTSSTNDSGATKNEPVRKLYCN